MLPSHELVDALVSPTPITQQFDFPLEKLSAWQERVVYCLKGVSMKMALYLSLVNHTRVDAREAISSAFAEFVMVTNPDEGAVNTFLTEQFAKYGVELIPNGSYLACKDFMSAFGFRNTFQATVAVYLFELWQVMRENPGIAVAAAVEKAFPEADVCVGREILHGLAEVAAEMEAFDEF